MQIELSKLTDGGKLVVAEGSAQEVYIDKPEVIVQCLKALLGKEEKEGVEL